MKLLFSRKAVCLVLLLVIIVTSAFIVSYAYIPDSPISVSGLWANGETKTFLINNTPINLDYSESYVESSFSWEYITGHYPIEYYYAIDGGNCIHIYGDRVVKLTGNIEYLEYSPDLRKVIKNVGVGSTRSEIQSAFGAEHLRPCGCAYPLYHPYETYDLPGYSIHVIYNGQSFFCENTTAKYIEVSKTF